MSIVAPPLEVFYSFAAADEPLLVELDNHLSILRHKRLITTWHTRQVGAGADLREALDSHLNSASLILLLVSADFLASNYCYGVEMTRAMERSAANPDRVRVIPILLRAVDGWERTPFGQLQPLPGNREPVMNWPNRDEAFKQVARGIRAALEDLQRLTLDMPTTARPPIWEIPYPRNPFFTGREELLQKLAATLKPGQPAALSQPQAISGLGGIGKTQLAIEYAHRFASHYQAVFWTLADTRESLISGYVSIARRLNLPQQDAQDQMLTVQATRRWLSTNADWLLILDNADDLPIIREFLPPAYPGHILLTTRAQSTGRLAARIEVNTMSQDTGTLFLLRRAVRLPSPDASLEQASVEDINTAREIYTELGGLPLALDQAGAYIEKTQSSLTHYLELYRKRRTDLLSYHSDLVNDHPEPVATTWSLAFEKVEQKSTVAANLLRLCSFLYPDAIPEEIIVEGIRQLASPTNKSKKQRGDSWLSRFISFLQWKQEAKPVEDDSFMLDEAIAVLSTYSLIHRDTKDNTLSIHRLVQAVLRDSMNERVQSEWSLHIVQALDVVFPEVDFATWQQCERYLAQALSCADMIEQENITSLDAASLFNKIGWYLDDRARYIEAEPLYRRALGIREQQLGGEHPDTATSLNNLAGLYYELGRIEEAEPLFRRALAIRERALGLKHPDTAQSLFWLAFSHHQQRQYEQARPLYERALAIYERVLGPRHPRTVNLRSQYKSLLQAMESEVDEEE